jgi:hypothetical protein
MADTEQKVKTENELMAAEEEGNDEVYYNYLLRITQIAKVRRKKYQL